MFMFMFMFNEDTDNNGLAKFLYKNIFQLWGKEFL